LVYTSRQPDRNFSVAKAKISAALRAAITAIAEIQQLCRIQECCLAVYQGYLLTIYISNGTVIGWIAVRNIIFD